jgi:hypothetical protein
MYVYLAIALLSAALSGFGTWKVQNWRYAAIEKDRIEAAAEKAKFDRRAVDVAAAGHEKDKAQIRTEFLVITEKVEHAIQSDFYAAGQPACFDDSGLRALSDSLGAAPAPSVPASAVPQSHPAR